MIIVLDFTTNEVHTYNVDHNFDWSRTADFLAEEGHRLKDCEYMISRNSDVEFYYHNR